MGNFFYFILCGLIFSITLTIIYFKKEHIKTNETRIFSTLLIINLISLISELSCNYVGFTSDVDSFLSHVVTKSYLVCLMTFVLYMTLYIYNICYLEREKPMNKYYKKLENISYIVWFISAIGCILLPIETFKGFATGYSVNWTYLMSTVVLSSWIIPFIKNIKNINKKKIIPIIMFVFFMIIISIIQKINPEITLTTVMEFLVVFIMYHTIENPDIRMINKLKLLNNEALKASKYKSDFLSSMSHEIRTPLNAIVGLSEDNLRYKDSIPNEVYENSIDIMNASNILLEIVGNILDINKIEAGKMELMHEVYNFKEEITNMCNVTQTRIGEKPIRFNLNISDDIPYELIGDKGKVKEIVNNILSNAIKYTEKGKIDLNISCVNDNVCYIKIECIDTGKGIRKEMINRLFNRFDRLDEEKNVSIEGTGLGLNISKSLCEMMGGSIEVDSVYGKGSTFTINIIQDISKLKCDKCEEVILKSNYSFDNMKVLIVDDNKLNIKVARRSLDGLNMIIDECYDGIECLNKCKVNNYDLILLDIMMPNMGGEETIKELKKKKTFNSKTIALTADALSGAKEKYISEGFDDYISKPFTKEQIIQKISNLSIK